MPFLLSKLLCHLEYVLILSYGFGYSPRVIAVALASGPMVMINSATGFRRVDSAKIATKEEQDKHKKIIKQAKGYFGTRKSNY